MFHAMNYILHCFIDLQSLWRLIIGIQNEFYESQLMLKNFILLRSNQQSTMVYIAG